MPFEIIPVAERFSEKFSIGRIREEHGSVYLAEPWQRPRSRSCAPSEARAGLGGFRLKTHLPARLYRCLPLG